MSYPLTIKYIGNYNAESDQFKTTFSDCISSNSAKHVFCVYMPFGRSRSIGKIKTKHILSTSIRNGGNLVTPYKLYFYFSKLFTKQLDVKSIKSMRILLTHNDVIFTGASEIPCSPNTISISVPSNILAVISLPLMIRRGFAFNSPSLLHHGHLIDVRDSSRPMYKYPDYLNEDLRETFIYETEYIASVINTHNYECYSESLMAFYVYMLTVLITSDGVVRLLSLNKGYAVRGLKRDQAFMSDYVRWIKDQAFTQAHSDYIEYHLDK